jgi:hypothetical protein
MGHPLQFVSGGNDVPADANAAACLREAQSSCMLPTWQGNALLRGQTVVNFATPASHSNAVCQSIPAFADRGCLGCLGSARSE